MKKLVHLTFIFIVLTGHKILHTYRAVVISPVTDLLLRPMSELKFLYKNGYSYEYMPIYGDIEACRRAHQLRANDLVEVLDERDDEVQVSIFSCFYNTRNNAEPHQKYWMRKKDLIPLQTLTNNNTPQSCIPKPITLHEPIPNAAILTKPWYDRTSKMLFSAGTRFALDHSDKRHHYIFVFNPAKQTYTITSCPRAYCKIHYAQSLKEKRSQMIDLARSWTQNYHGFIPYAWGGCSIVKRMHYHRVSEYTLETTDGKKYSYYQWSGKNYSPKTGIDCSGLILLAAQSVGIPYFCKNSDTVETTLLPVSAENPLEEGDIIWTKGHVMLVANLKCHTLIEARGYRHGYGKVQEIPLSEHFKGINTYQDLLACYEYNKPVIRLDKDRNVTGDPVTIKLFKIAME